MEILVGVDGSEGAASALRWAVEEAALHGAAVEAVLAWGLLNQSHIPSGKQDFDPHYDRAAADEALRWYVDEAVGQDRAGRRTVNDLPFRALVEAAAHDQADLLVLGGRHLGQLRAALLGSVTYSCLHLAPCPIAVIRPGMANRTSGGRIVVGVDGSDNARRALEWAVAEAAARGARLDVVHGWHVPYVGGMYGPTITVDPHEFEDVTRGQLHEAVSTVDTSGLAEPPREIIAYGGAPEALLKAGADADLLVVGSRGRGGFSGLLLGSTSSQVVHHAAVPVVVVPKKPR